MKFKNLLAVFCTVVSLAAAVPVIMHDASVSEPYYADSVKAEGDTITTDDGQKWYRVKSFEDDKNYVISVKKPDGSDVLLTAPDDQNGFIWHYYRRTMVPSTYSVYTSLSTYSNYLSCTDGKLSYGYRESIVTDMVWATDGSVLSYTEKGDTFYLKYDEGADSPFSMTPNRDESAEISVYTNGDTLERCIKVQPCSENYVTEGSGFAAPEYSFTLSDGVITDSIIWSVDGNRYETDSTAFRADELAGKEAGVHRICCFIEAHDTDGITYKEKSSDALFVIAKGVVPDSVMTFSDVHEEYDLIGNAIETTMNRTGGYIPGLIICTGDLVNGPTPASDRMLEHYYPLIKPQLGGIDTVFVSGNHDPAKAASEMSVKADLGAAGDLTEYGGLIFDGRSDAVKSNGSSSLSDRNIKVFSINYEAVICRRNGEISSYSYENVIESTRKFLENTAKDYHGELIVISAHSGLHTLGIDPASVNPEGYPLFKWIGDNAYNVSHSYDLASVINDCAAKYNMNIIYLFGHDHSRQETEMFLTKGNTLTSTVSYTDHTFETLPLEFTYAHSGYLSTTIGIADSKYSFVHRTEDGYSFDLIRTYDNTVRHTEIADRYAAYVQTPETTAPAVTEAPAVEQISTAVETSSDVKQTETAANTPAVSENETAVTSSDNTSTENKPETTTSLHISDLPKTGRNAPAALALTGNALILLVIGASAVKRSRKK